MRRGNQVALCFEFKVRYNNLNNEQKTALKMQFVEAKWSYNYMLSQTQGVKNGIFDFKRDKLNTITHKDKDGNDVEVTLKYLGSSMKDSIIDCAKESIKGLAAAKKQGLKVGKLKFKSNYSTIRLKQYGITHSIVSDNRIRIQGIKKPLPVSGLKQLEFLNKNCIPYEFASATISHVANKDYFIRLTVWVDKAQYLTYRNSKKHIQVEQLGIDFGCETSFTLSTGEKLNVFVEESERLKKTQKKLHKAKKGSNNRYRLRLKLQKEYYKMGCLKDELANKICNYILNIARTVIMQDEQLNTWKVKHGKKVQHSVLGRVKTALMRSESVHVLDRFLPTTKLCTVCGELHSDIKLWDREFVCPHCGATHTDRDVHAAQNMVWLFNHIHLGVDGSEFKREDLLSSLREYFSRITQEG